MQYMIVIAKQVAGGPDELERYLNARAGEGWTVLTADQGVIYLARLVRS